MAQRKQRSATTRKKMSISHSVATEARGKDIAMVARMNLAVSPTESWRELTVEDKEIVVARLFSGESVSLICQDLELDPGHIYRACYLDDDYAERVAIARQVGQHALVDKLLEIPFWKDMNSNDKNLLSDNIKWAAARIAKTSKTPLGNYNERTEVHEQSDPINIILPTGFQGFGQPPQIIEIKQENPDSDDLSDSGSAIPNIDS